MYQFSDLLAGHLDLRRHLCRPATLVGGPLHRPIYRPNDFYSRWILCSLQPYPLLAHYARLCPLHGLLLLPLGRLLHQPKLGLLGGHRQPLLPALHNSHHTLTALLILPHHSPLPLPLRLGGSHYHSPRLLGRAGATRGIRGGGAAGVAAGAMRGPLRGLSLMPQIPRPLGAQHSLLLPLGRTGGANGG